MGLFGDKDAIIFSSIAASKDSSGNPDPYKAAGMAMGMSMASGKDWSFKDTMKMGAMLGASGAFDKKKR